MYEGQTYESILERMLRAADPDGELDTREGSVLWLALAPAAAELQSLYIAVDTVLNETFGDTASRPYLLRRAAERGLTPRPASYAVVGLTVTPPTAGVEVGTRFSVGELNYAVTAVLGGGRFELTCETAGEAGNHPAGRVVPIEYVADLETCTVTGVELPAEDEEDTETFRRRYFDSLNAQAYGGNRADYLDKIGALDGVGGVKLYRAWNGDLRPADLLPPAGTADYIASLQNAPKGVKDWLTALCIAGTAGKLTVGGTVRAVIIDSTYRAPTATLVERVQTAVDPTQNAGEGVGIAPIGHVVRVEGVGTVTVDVSCVPTYQAGWTWEDVSAEATAVLEGYFGELAQGWAESDTPLVVRVSQAESRLLAVGGIVDISELTLNGVPANCVLPADCIPILGTVTPREEGANGA